MMRRLIALLGFNIILLARPAAASGAGWYEMRRPRHQLRITSLPSPPVTAEISMQIAA